MEALFAATLLALLVTGLAGSYLYGQEAQSYAGNISRATLLAEEGLEAVRNIRDAGFANLTEGPHGLATTSNQWNFSGTSDTTGIYTRQITVTAVAGNTIYASQTGTTTNMIVASLGSVLGGYSVYPVYFQIVGLPDGADANFTPDQCTPTCIDTLTITTSATPLGSYPITMIASARGAQTLTIPFTLVVH